MGGGVRRSEGACDAGRIASLLFGRMTAAVDGESVRRTNPDTERAKSCGKAKSKGGEGGKGEGEGGKGETMTRVGD